MSRPNYDFIVLIGRFQPMHYGHVDQLRAALDRADQVLLLVGSTNRIRGQRNPFTYDERRVMIRAVITEELGAAALNRVHIWALPDNRAKLREKAVTLVLRPDSGEPEAVLPMLLTKAITAFGFTMNSKGYAVLNGVKLLWGDGIDEDTCVVPFEIAKSMGFSADSIMVGSGGGLMQRDLDRDTCKFAFKASAVKERGVWCGVAKDPITDPGKASKRGKLLLHRGDSGLVTLPRRSDDAPSDELRLVYHNGVVMTEDLATIRARVEAQG